MAQLTITPSSSNLGTITNDIQYTVTSDTAGTLTASIMVNDAIFAQQSLTSGTSSSILITQLPTGENTITLTATLTESGGGTTTQTATWQYTKTPITFPTAGSVADLSANGQTILPTTLAEAVRTSPVWGGSLDLALQSLCQAALYKTAAPTQQIGTLTEGTIIYLNENGSPVPFYVAKQNYEPNHNTNRTLVVRKDAVTQGAWNSSGVNTYNGSTIDTWFNSTYLNTLDSDVKTAIGMTNIPATSPRNSGVIRLEKGVFALSLTELGLSYLYSNVEGNPLSIASVLRDNVSDGQWTRTPQTGTTINALSVTSSGSLYDNTATASVGYRPAFTFPSAFGVWAEEPSPGLFDIQNNLLLSLPGSGTGLAQIEVGSYKGTGTSGKTNPNTLTFGFVPEVIFINPNSSYSGTNQFHGILYPKLGMFGLSQTNSAAIIKQSTISLNENNVSWYASAAANQCNYSGVTYYYVAIG